MDSSSPDQSPGQATRRQLKGYHREDRDPRTSSGCGAPWKRREAARHNLGSLRWRWLQGHRGSLRGAAPLPPTLRYIRNLCLRSRFSNYLLFLPVPCASLSALPPGRGAEPLREATASTEPFGGVAQTDPALPHPSLHHRNPAARPSSSHPASPAGCPGTPRAGTEGALGAGPRAPLTRAPSAPGPAARRDAAPGAGPWSAAAPPPPRG